MCITGPTAYIYIHIIELSAAMIHSSNEATNETNTADPRLTNKENFENPSMVTSDLLSSQIPGSINIVWL